MSINIFKSIDSAAEYVSTSLLYNESNFECSYSSRVIRMVSFCAMGALSSYGVYRVISDYGKYNRIFSEINGKSAIVGSLVFLGTVLTGIGAIIAAF